MRITPTFSVGRAICALLAAGLFLGVGHRSLAADGKSGDQNEDEPKNAKHHVVQPGETVGTIALKYGSSVKDILGWNDLELGEAREGMKLVVKSDEEPENQEDDEPLPVVHEISKGDTLGGIAERYNVSVSQVKRWNPNLNPRLLQLGDRVRL
ncbi:MAG: LysM peptidoglycan-binding domain-containing protein, partial [Bradymonadaceae bacterium]